MLNLSIFTGLRTPKDGLRRLLQMEESKGIWTQKMQMRLDKKWVIIIDNENGDIVERFPMSLISDPIAYTSDDPRELYNNILIFIVKGDPKNKNHSPSEMHIFQCARVKAHEIVDEMKMFMSGKWKRGYKENSHHIPPPPVNPPPDPPANGINVKEQVNMFNANTTGSPRHSALHQSQSGSQPRIDGMERTTSYGRESNDETSSTGSDKYEKDVAILNHCFDDIERFIARLQHAAAAFKELERRRKSRKNKKKDMGDGMLSMRAKPPPERHFVDILQKFKLSFNLLAKLKSHIHDPNAPELVHFLFTPLALIVDAAKDSNYSSNLPARVVTPLLTREAVDLLMNCCTSKETDLWNSLGDAWLIPRDQWKGYEGNYHPIFSDGWAPEYPFSEDRERAEITAAAAASAAQRFRRDEIRQAQEEAELREREYHRVSSHDRDSRYGSEYYYSSECGERERSGSPAVPSEQMPYHQGYDNRQYDSRRIEIPRRDVYAERGASPSPLLGREYHDRDARSELSADSDQVPSHLDPYRQYDRHQQWLDDLRMQGAKIVQVMYPRTANNDKELTIVRGECLEVLDDSRKWWKARNIRGQIGHVPHTIVTPYTGGVVEDDVFNNPLYATRGGRDYYSPSGSPVGRECLVSGPAPREHFPNQSPNQMPPSGTGDWVRRERQGKKESPSVSSSLEEAAVSARSASPAEGRTKTSNGPASPKITAVQCPPPPPPPLPTEKSKIFSLIINDDKSLFLVIAYLTYSIFNT
ncbi:epidermal growth factor receptor kinase substrate 8-like protein 2 [Centruroides sculpturatus]|uniref:epidermal growth factor receptor kinase substrate 8-like protein 2 n=1 Tax=Centruroides sculpturatus TaxID=218467 RepID=UPI000C6E99C9|nr:epidermal growth factor receptor kinase substrate 8-like protein 2 [Centruroides sculpturatus]